MIRERRAMLARVAVLVALTAVCYVLGEGPVRAGETELSLWVLRAAGAAVSHGPGTSIVVDHSPGGVFAAVLTPSCSSWASVLALACLALVMPGPPPARRLAAALTSGAVVFAGNIVRVTASIAVGLWAGPPSLVLFHNVVGSMFGFAYIVGGFIVIIAVLLPRRGTRLEALPRGAPQKEIAGAPEPS